MNLNTKDAVCKTLNEIENKAEDSVIMSVQGSIAENSHDRINSIQDEEEKNQSARKTMKESILEKVKTTSYFEAQKYIDSVKNKMLIVTMYKGLTIAICSTSSVVSLVCLLMIAFQIEGLINLFYICFCLYYLTKVTNFVYQKNWTFPQNLRRILKPFVMAELFLQFGFQLPVSNIHDNESKSSSWQRIIGFIPIWRLSEVDNFPETINVSNLVLKCIMFAFILIQQNIFSSPDYRIFCIQTLSGIRTLSDRKAEAMAYLYNNFKLRTTIQNQFEKDKMMKKLGKLVF